MPLAETVPGLRPPPAHVVRPLLASRASKAAHDDFWRGLQLVWHALARRSPDPAPISRPPSSAICRALSKRSLPVLCSALSLPLSPPFLCPRPSSVPARPPSPLALRPLGPSYPADLHAFSPACSRIHS
ncbi:uncharacterized protein TRAVEDRAFT_54719 [Trametes versicolor FP-101664 SS1]|uniref:Uncharacterized protein n=1 Tax=Trametes versicolor (strain FP-101664) TaxID=717944 RepID=R7S668_TRAVS|nr:uncharacterized protein TRAVEDRAFT_54719 [Trametes versicolor FP-101664 SS1]EIW51261.1 hypothetical protein TRAVEDRAFT_54719 [Trametes versicolor FP-101664 SS1]